MIIDEKLILKLEDLARLPLTSEERARLRVDLEEIVGMIEKLKELDTTGIAPLMHLSEVEDVRRGDEVKNELGTAEALQNANKTQDAYFKVPKVIDRST